MATVLMVEDEEQIRVLAESVLQEAGHKVVTATGIEGAKALLDTDQQIDVLFLDLNLGGDVDRAYA
jgi:DNA-binding NtrC family response regulator